MATLLNQSDEFDETASARIQLYYQHVSSLFCPLPCCMPKIDSTTMLAAIGMGVMVYGDLMYDVFVVAYGVLAAAIANERMFEDLTITMIVAAVADDG